MKRIKIAVNYLDKNELLSEEKVWGIHHQDNYYYIDSIPFFIPNLAYGDLILVEEEDGVLSFDDLITASDNSTVRIIFFNENPAYIQQVLQALEAMYCEWEGFIGKPYYTVNVPKDADYSPVKQYLDGQQTALDYEESCLSDKHRLDVGGG